jgi:ribosome biogenesis GTPase
MTQKEHSTVLEKLGWDSFFENAFQSLDLQDKLPARVIGQERNRYKVVYQHGEGFATISGRALYRELSNDIRPAVGDWVIVRRPVADNDTVIEAVLPRKTKISRQVAGGRGRYAGGNTEEQVLAANVDTVFIVCSQDNERSASLRKIERYLTMVWSAGAFPVIILNKVDLYPDVSATVSEIEQIAMGVPIAIISATEKVGLKTLEEFLIIGKTAVFLGPSGVGKSSIINALLEEERLKVSEVRESDFRGRHTTTRRELFLLPKGGMVIDTPGMREIQMWGEEDDLSGTFQDIERLARECRFRDCAHGAEPGCAVQKAITEGVIDRKRLQNYRKLQREIRHLTARQADKTRVEEKLKWKKISQWQKKYQKNKEDIY